MAYVASMTTPGHGAQAIYTFKEHMKSLGWTVPRSSDGITFNGSGDQITAAGGGAGGMHNASAWFVLRQPAATNGTFREFMFQRAVSNNYGWTTYYSYGAGFTGGTATVAATATDQGSMSPQLLCRIFPDDGMYRFAAVADNAAPYGWYFAAWPIGGGTSTTLVMFDPLVSGTYDTGDNDPYVVYVNNNNSTSTAPPQVGRHDYMGVENGAGAPRCWYNKGIAGQGYVVVPVLYYTTNASNYIPGVLPTNSVSGKDDMLPFIYARRAALGAPAGVKGMSSMVRWMAVSTRSPGDTLSVSAPGAKDRISLGNISMPWDGSTPLV